ncbi:DNA-binding protein [Lysinibacillus xylanilyticus]|uniref:DNA-binding protein n=1 Tax=Lysinibacillus xylanilyticus TaxID=582475 RepID=UPI002B24A9DD|nr:DNA-binding protein [Lysinibacillus xylanilyticus]MEB2301521.1 DNA-binding protein [Lysinibacillus xylanilyticus]
MEYTFGSTEELLEFLSEELLSASEAAELLEISKVRLGQLVKNGKLTAAKEQPKMFLKSMLLDKKDELESLRKKFRPYDE